MAQQVQIDPNAWSPAGAQQVQIDPGAWQPINKIPAAPPPQRPGAGEMFMQGLGSGVVGQTIRNERQQSLPPITPDELAIAQDRRAIANAQRTGIMTPEAQAAMEREEARQPGFWARQAGNLGGVVGSLPEFGLGAAAGAAAAATAPVSVPAMVGSAAVLGGGMAAAHGAASVLDPTATTGDIALEAAKGGAIGGLAAVGGAAAGKVASGLAARFWGKEALEAAVKATQAPGASFARKFVGTPTEAAKAVGGTAGEIAGFVGGDALVNWHMPTVESLADATVLIGALKIPGGVKRARKLMKEGKTPAQAVDTVMAEEGLPPLTMPELPGDGATRPVVPLQEAPVGQSGPRMTMPEVPLREGVERIPQVSPASKPPLEVPPQPPLTVEPLKDRPLTPPSPAPEPPPTIGPGIGIEKMQAPDVMPRLMAMREEKGEALTTAEVQSVVGGTREKVKALRDQVNQAPAPAPAPIDYSKYSAEQLNAIGAEATRRGVHPEVLMREVEATQASETQKAPPPAERQRAKKAAGQIANDLETWEPHTRDSVVAISQVPGVEKVSTYAKHDDHTLSAGMAADVWPALPATKDPAGGIAIAEHLMNNADAMNVKYVIWNQRIWNRDRDGGPKPYSEWRVMEDRGGVTKNHQDHVHVSFTGKPGDKAAPPAPEPTLDPATARKVKVLERGRDAAKNPETKAKYQEKINSLEQAAEPTAVETAPAPSDILAGERPIVPTTAGTPRERVNQGIAQATARLEEPGTKQPWEMTKDEWVNSVNYHGAGESAASEISQTGIVNRGDITKNAEKAARYTIGWSDAPESGGSMFAVVGRPPVSHGIVGQGENLVVVSQMPSSAWADPHRYVIEQALAAGKPVPAEVLADYPDLARRLDPMEGPLPESRLKETPAETPNIGTAADMLAQPSRPTEQSPAPQNKEAHILARRERKADVEAAGLRMAPIGKKYINGEVSRKEYLAVRDRVLTESERAFGDALANKYGRGKFADYEGDKHLVLYNNNLQHVAENSKDAAELAKIMSSIAGLPGEGEIAWAIAMNPHASNETFSSARNNAALLSEVDKSDITNMDARRAKRQPQQPVVARQPSPDAPQAPLSPTGATQLTPAAVTAAARETKSFGDMAFISDLHARVAPDMPIADFKDALVSMHRKGDIELARADLVEAMPADKVAASRATYLNAEFHMMRAPGEAKAATTRSRDAILVRIEKLEAKRDAAKKPETQAKYQDQIDALWKQADKVDPRNPEAGVISLDAPVEVVKELGKVVKRAFVGRGTKEQRAGFEQARVEMEGIRGVAANRGKRLQRDFKRAMKAEFPDDAERTLARDVANKALRGDIELVPAPKGMNRNAQLQALIDANEGRAPVAPVSKRVIDAVAGLRAEQDAGSRAIAERGIVQGNLATVVENNIGFWTNRGYKVFGVKGWRERVQGTKEWKEAVKYRMQEWDRAVSDPSKLTDVELADFAERVFGMDHPKKHLFDGDTMVPEARAALEAEIASLPKANRATVENGLNVMLSEMADKGQSGYFSGRMGAQNRDALKARKDIPEPIRKVMGEYWEPEINFSRSQAAHVSMIANDAFAKSLYESGKGKWIFDSVSEMPAGAGEQGFRRIPDDPKYGVLRGKLVAEPVLEMMESMHVESGAAMRVLNAVAGTIRGAKTIGNFPGGYIRNFAGAGMAFGRANGVPLKTINETIRVLTTAENTMKGLAKVLGVEGEGGLQAAKEKMISLGVLDTGVAGNIMRENARRMRRNPDADLSQTGVVSGSIEKLGEWWLAGDNIWKHLSFVENRARYEGIAKKEGWTPEQLDRKAADIVRAVQPTYDAAFPVVTDMRRSALNPFYQDFVTWHAEQIRNNINIVKLIGEEAKSGDPTLRRSAMNRAAGLAAHHGLMTAGATAFSAWALGDSGEDKDWASRRLGPYWTKNGPRLYTDESGAEFIDMGFTDPDAMMHRTAMAVASGEMDAETAINALSELTDPVFGTSILAETLVTLASNKKQSGAPLYLEADDYATRLKSIAEEVARTTGPPALAIAMTAIENMMGKTSERSRPMGDKLRSLLTGFSRWSVDPIQQFSMRAGQTRTRLNEVAQRANKTAREWEGIEPADAQRASEPRRKYFEDELVQDGVAARILGATSGDLVRALRDEGFAADDRRRIMRQISSAYTERMSPEPATP